MVTELPDEPAGQVPIGGMSSANAIRGSAVDANNAPPACNTVRRDGLMNFCMPVILPV
jgi:hypothetical protein